MSQPVRGNCAKSYTKEQLALPATLARFSSNEAHPARSCHVLPCFVIPREEHLACTQPCYRTYKLTPNSRCQLVSLKLNLMFIMLKKGSKPSPVICAVLNGVKTNASPHVYDSSVETRHGPTPLWLWCCLLHVFFCSGSASSSLKTPDVRFVYSLSYRSPWCML